MTTPIWILQFAHDAALKNSFIDSLMYDMKGYDAVLRECLHKGDLHGAQIQLGKQEALDALLHKISSYEREEKDRVEYIQKTKGE